MSGPGLLAVHAHPDDETLSNGALLATWAAAGWPVTVVTCTRGEQGEVIPADLAHLERDADALGRHREHELARALEALGVRDHLFLDAVPPSRETSGSSASARSAGPSRPRGGPDRFVDSGMAWLSTGRAGPAPDAPDHAFARVDVEDAAERLVGVLGARGPRVVVGYEPGGGYGHPDHVHAHRVMMRAVELLPVEDRPVVLWTVVDERALRSGLDALGAVPDGVVVPGPDDPVPSAVVPSQDVDLRVELAPVLGRVRAALAAHATQVLLLDVPLTAPDALGAFTLSNARVQPLLPHESYRTAPVAGARTLVGDVSWPAGAAPVR